MLKKALNMNIKWSNKMTFQQYGKGNNVTRFSSRKQVKKWERKCEEQEKERQTKRLQY
jgi:hypothetical protein